MSRKPYPWPGERKPRRPLPPGRGVISHQVPQRIGQWFNMAAAAEYIGVTQRALKNLIANRAITYRKHPGEKEIRLHKVQLDAFLAEGEHPRYRPEQYDVTGNGFF